MTRRSTHDQPVPPEGPESLGSATRALADATATLTKLIGAQVSSELSGSLAASLREAARGLADASASAERHAGGKRADERRRDRVDRTRADLLAAAAQVFADRGYEGASVGDIAAAAGYTKGALYAHFGSKNDLFLELARTHGCGFPAEVGDPGRDLADELSARLTATGDDTAMLLVLEVLAYGVRHPESRPDLEPQLTAALDRLAERVRDDRRAHEVRDDPGAPLEPPTAPSSQDVDTAIGLVAVANFAALLGAFSGRLEGSPQAGARLISRLLER